MSEFKNRFITVQELIDELQLIENKSLPVLGYLAEDDNGNTIDIIEIESIDTSISDRIDINLKLTT